MHLTSRNNNENISRDFEMMIGERKASDSTPSNRTVSSDPFHYVRKPVSEREDDGDRPGKRRRWSVCTTIPEHSQVSVDRAIPECKRKASKDAGSPERKVQSLSNSAKNRSCNSPASRVKVVADYSVELSTSSECRTDSTRTSSSSESDEDECYILGKVSAEDEAAFEMSSKVNVSRDALNGKYLQLHPLGSGGFGSVFDGVRKSDRLPVAIKHIPRGGVKMAKVICNGREFLVILEVALMLKAAGLPGQPVGQCAAVSLLDWYMFTEELILVMEKPPNSMDLARYLEVSGGSLSEREAKMILKQLVNAVIDIEDKGVFHRDIKLQNVLIQLSSGGPRVRIIDFGCGSLSMHKPFCHFCGTFAYSPPEWFDEDVYFAYPTTVWQLGALFYLLLRGHDDFTTLDFINRHIGISSTCSTEVQALLRLCLARNPKKRVLLVELYFHPALGNLDSSDGPGGDM